MQESSPPLMQVSASLNRPLPPDVVFFNHGWLTRYRMYPSFSWQWLRGRFLLFSCVLIGLALLAFAQAALDEASRFSASFNAISALLFSFLLIAFIGPALATIVRHARLKPRLEVGGVVTAVLLGIVLGMWMNTYQTRYIKEQYQQYLSPRPVDPIQEPKKPLFKQFALAIANATQFLILNTLLGGGLGLIAYFREKVRLQASLRRKELGLANAARREAELRLSVLQAQVEPHFLFNTFAGLRGLIRTEPERAIMLLDRLTDYLRASIPKMRDDGINDSSTIGAQIDSALAYLELMKVRMGERLSFELQVEPALRKADFPPLIVISLVENAIKHGIEPKPAGGHIKLTVSAQDKRLCLTVMDNGVGFEVSQNLHTAPYAPPGKVGGLGLSNIRAQLQTIYGDNARLILKNPPDGGFSASVELPFVLEDANV